MLFSLALILFCGFALGGIMQKLKLPALLGMMTAGVLLGPYVLNLIDPSILNVSSELRQIALIVILIRAGLALDLKDLKKVGRPAILMCFIPATVELIAVVIFAPILLDVSYLEAAIMGSVLAAVSPAVVVPGMLKLMSNGYGTEKSIPQLILGGASVDGIYAIILFTSFIEIYKGQVFDFLNLVKIPIAILLGLTLGIVTGILVVKIFKKIHVRDTVKMLLLLGASFFLVVFEEAVKPFFPVSGLLAIMVLGATILHKDVLLAKILFGQSSKIWVLAELLLFVLVGAAVDIGYMSYAGIMAVYIIFIALVFRIAGVLICLLKTNLNKKERLFTAVSYLPKATVQGAIGGIPLALGIASGNVILAIAVLSIMITAPIGAIGIELTYKRLLTRRKNND